MEYAFLATQIIHQIGITFGVGASTFALTFYIAALMDGIIDESEKRFLHIVYFVLRIGMALIGFSLLSIVVLAYMSEALPYLLNPINMMEWLILLVIIVNAVLMTMHKMPMRFGPVLAGGSWYSLFFLTTFPFGAVSFLTLTLYYVAFLLIFYAGFTLVKNHFLPTKPQI